MEMDKETREEILESEDELLKGLLDAARDRESEVVTIEIARKGRVYFRFRIRALTEKEVERCRELATKYTKNRQGIKIPEEASNAKYRSLLIHTATVEEDRKKLWDNKALWEKLNVLNGVDVIDQVLLPGEKEKIIEKLDEISGFVDDSKYDEIEELAKN